MSVRTTKVKGAKSVTLKQTFNCGDKNDRNKYVYHRYGPSNQQATIAAFERVLDMKQRELDLERQTCAVRVAEYEHILDLERRACAVRVAEFEDLLKMKTAKGNNGVKTPSQDTQEYNNLRRRSKNQRENVPDVHTRRSATANTRKTQDVNGRTISIRGGNLNNSQNLYNHDSEIAARQVSNSSNKIDSQAKAVSLPKRIPIQTTRRRESNEQAASKQKRS